MIELKFDSGQWLVLIAPKNQNGILSELVQDHSLHMKNLGPIFGSLMTRSAYDQYATLLNTSPAAIRVFGQRSLAVRDQMLLIIKAIALPASLETGAFTFQFPDKRGFQIGNPAKSRTIVLELFDMNGHDLEINCGTAKNDVGLTQAELNRILKTIHPAYSQSLEAQDSSTEALGN